LEHFVETFARHGYLAVFVLMLLESACIPIPSEVTMVFGGALASPKVFDPGFSVDPVTHLNFLAVALAGVAGNVVGSWLAYGVGRAVGRGPLDRWGRYVGIRSHDIDKAERWWRKRGDATVFFSRMLPVIRTFISLPAGIERMPIGRFTVYTAAGCIPWVLALTGAGYGLGNNYRTILGPFRYATFAIAGLVIVALGVYLIRRRRTAPGSEG
jgi:membrane protein DedA with SNARE-associated domain